MSLERTINAFSPDKPEELVSQVLYVQIGDGSSVRPTTETFLYDPGTMATGIFLSLAVASGTRPAVYLRGLRMLLRDEGATSGGDVALSEAVNPVTGELATSVVFVGTTYAVAPDDTIIVSYWTTD